MTRACRFPVADSFSLPCETQRLDGDIQPEFVSVFEAVNERARDAIDSECLISWW